MFLAVAESDWPNALDKTTVVIFCLIAVGLPLLGYIGMVLDVRAYLRSLRRALVRVAIYLPDIPAWAVRETPSDLRALGLRAPCTEEDIKRAYRRLAEKLHPDRGGDTRRFLLLQEHFEKSIDYVRNVQPEIRTVVP